LILLTIGENNQYISQIFNSFNSDYFKEVSAGKEEEDEDSLEQKICNKLFESETCEKVQEKEELTEEEIKAAAIINRYLEPVESEKKSIDDSLNNETEIDSSISSSSSTILLNEVESKDSTNSNQQINNGPQSTQINQSSINYQNVLNNTQSLNNLTQEQLIYKISSTINQVNPQIDKNQIIQALQNIIKNTQLKGGDVITSLRKITENILQNPNGPFTQKIVELAKQ
jgi:hypothetical protein